MTSLNTSTQKFHLSEQPSISRKSFLFALLVGLSASTLGCAETSESGGAATQNEAANSQIEIVSTFAPITSFAKAVAGDRANVTQLVPHNISPHDYNARPEELVSLGKADVVIENGLEMEPFLEEMIKSSENQDVVVIDSSEGITAEEYEEGSHEGEHDHAEEAHDDQGHEGEEYAGEAHDDHDHEGEDHGEKAAKADKHAGHQHGAYDPHIWLDPKRAVQQVENIRDGLIAADPDGKDVYQTNAQAYIEELNALDAEIANQLKPYEGKTFVTYHDFSHYFAQSYGLTAEFLVDVPSDNATPGDVTRVIDTVKQSNLKTLLTEPQAEGSPFAALARDLQISVSQFDPMGTSPNSEIQADSYIETMRTNVKNLSTAFSAQTQQSFWINAPSRNTALVGFSVLPMPFTR